MHTRTCDWQTAARKLQQLKIHAGEPVLWRRPKLEARQLDQVIDAVQRAFGTELPRSYRQFLHTYDGWPGLFAGTSLLSLGELMNGAYLHRATSFVDDEDMTPTPSYVSLCVPGWLRPGMIPVAVDAAGQVAFALDPESCSDDGEMEIVMWIAGLGMRVSSFAQMLQQVCDLYEQRRSVAPQAALAACA